MNINWLSIVLKVTIYVLNLILSIIIDTGHMVLDLHKTAVDWLGELEDESS